MTAIVGILNLSPDSFAEDRSEANRINPLIQVERMLEAGADVIDIGAESSRPGASPLTAREEWQRLNGSIGRIVELIKSANRVVSVDTRHADTAARVLDLGADWINTVDGVSDAMAPVLSRHDCRVVVMHAISVPVIKGLTLPANVDAVAHVKRYFATRITALEEAGVDSKRIIIDPGVGFGTTRRQAIDIIRRAGEFSALGHPVLIGHSRKSFQTLFSDAPAHLRDETTLALSSILMTAGVEYLRVHDVARHVRLLQALSPNDM